VQAILQCLRYLGDPRDNSLDCPHGGCDGKIIFLMIFLFGTRGPCCRGPTHSTLPTLTTPLLRRWICAKCCVTLVVLYTKVDARCDGLATVVGRTNVDCTCDGRRAAARFFLNSSVWDNSFWMIGVLLFWRCRIPFLLSVQ